MSEHTGNSDLDAVYNAVLDFLENGGELPKDADRNPQERFRFQAAMFRALYRQLQDVKDTAKRAEHQAVVNAHRYTTLKDMMNVRMGILGGVIFIAQAIVAVIALLQGGS